ncbi:hypothetical protein GLOTRDRAFT_133967 [Gloeophyllum trabeum ATCC 11539]|uniref:Uncharacterized protein n=1 Tax=Gloeophyllum trabeum (strain ATCC 11539 / FP-39264 / Madison 617) TaxID=670483 RepID=S7PSL4_GLOTA|nr:uncharacterized protein GLOTRDRAFT_133967 [Gloeophyllum trabeum ATCC 11539]EPQ50413.1 hypothetical protein GLOTRDRAFT_133967 [Gloeophyllum trabeum ATCC 11539]
MTSVPSKSERWVASRLPAVERAPTKGLLDVNISARRHTKTALWADQVLSDYCLKPNFSLLRDHEEFKTFEALLHGLDIEPQTLRIATKYIESEGSTVQALHSQLVHPVWQLMEPEKSHNTQVNDKNQCLTTELRTAAAAMAYDTYIQLPIEQWSSANARDTAGGVRTDLIFSVLFHKKEARTRGMEARQDAVATELKSERPTTSKSRVSEARKDPAIFDIEMNLFPFEVKKLGQIDFEALNTIAKDAIKLGGSIPTGKYEGHVLGMRASLQQMLRYAVHYDTDMAALGDYRHNLVAMVPSTLPEDAKRYKNQIKSRKGVRKSARGHTKNKSKEEGTTGGKKPETEVFSPSHTATSKPGEEVIGSSSEGTQPKGQPSAGDSKKEVTWIYADEENVRYLVLFSAWTTTKGMVGWWEDVGKDFALQKKEKTDKHTETSHTVQLLTSVPQGEMGGVETSRQTRK